MIDPGPSADNEQVQALPRHLAFLGAFFGLVSLATFALIVVFRSGLDIPWRLLSFEAAIFLSVAWAPFLLPVPLRQRCFETPYLLPLPCLAMLVSPVLGLISALGPVMGWVYVLTALLTLYRARRALARLTATEVTFGGIAALLVALYLFGTFSPMGYASVYAPEFARIGTLKNDTYLHTAIAHIILNFGKFSVGYDGLSFLHYHLGSHILFATLSAIGSSTPLFAYPTGQLVLTIPLLYFSACLASLVLTWHVVRSTLALPFCVLATNILIEQFGFNSYFVSESFTLSLVMMLLVSPLLWGAGTTGRASILPRLMVALPIGFLLAGAKLSVGYVWGAATAYTTVRQSSWRTATTWILLIALTAIMLLAYRVFRENVTGLGGGFDLFYMFKAGYLYEGIVASLLVPSAAILLGLQRARREAAGSLRGALRTGATFQVELVVVVTIAAIIPGSVMVLEAAAWWYFVNVAHWFALPLFAAVLVGERPWLVTVSDRWSLVPSIAVALLAVFTASLIWRFGISPASPLRAGLEPVMALAKRMIREGTGSTEPSSEPPPLGRSEWWRLTGAPLFTPEITKLLAAAPGTRIATLVNAAADGKNKGFAVFVPPDNHRFWELTPWCATQPAMIPSLVGVPMLFGLPPAYRKCVTEFNGFSDYPDSESRDVERDALCHRANQRAIQRVFVLRSLTQPQENSIVDCGS